MRRGRREAFPWLRRSLGVVAVLVLTTSIGLPLVRTADASHGGEWHVVERVSISSDGHQSSLDSGFTAISASGRFVAFQTSTGTLVPGDTDGHIDVFVRDRLLGTTERVSVSSEGAQGNNPSEGSSISDDGRFVAFDSRADNLVAGDTNGGFDVFVRDRVLGTTERVSVSSAGAQGNDYSIAPSISGDGRFVAYASWADNLVQDDTNRSEDVFVRDRLLGTTERVSVAVGGSDDSNAGGTSISANGRFVTFESPAGIIAGDLNNESDIFVRDRLLGTTELVTVSSAGVQANSYSQGNTISADGRFIAFTSNANNLVESDTNGRLDVFVRDRLLGKTERVSVSAAGAAGGSVSSDGRFVSFFSHGDNLVAGDTNLTSDVFVLDRLLGTTERVSISLAGAQGNSASVAPALSADGRFIAFESDATNFAAGDTNGQRDIFVSERSTEGIGSILGRVTDTNGAPVQGVLIQTDAHAAVATGADGTYSISVTEGDKSLTPHQPALSTSLFVFSPAFREIRAGVTTGYDFIANAAPTVGGELPPPMLGKTGLIVIAHGWTNPADPLVVLNDYPRDCHGYPYDGFRAMELGLKGRLAAAALAGDQEAATWDVYFQCWADGSYRPNPTDAAQNARAIGAELGSRIRQRSYSKVHLIGHSAAAWMIDAAADRLTDRAVHVTFLDPFIGASNALVGDKATWADGYINTDDFLAAHTNDLKNQHFFNFDVTDFGNQYGSFGLDGGLNGGHGWPIDYYNCTLKRAGAPVVTCPAPTDNALAGYSLSIEAGRSLPTNRAVWGPGGCSKLLPTGTGPCDGSLTRVVKVLTPVVDFVTQVLRGPTGAATALGAAALQMVTGSPVWIEKTVTVEGHATFVQFEYDFDSVGGSGVLGVWVDDAHVYSASEAHALPGVEPTGPIPLPTPLGPGPHKVVFRLDALSGSSSSIVISNLQLGYEELTTPTMTPLVGGLIHSAAHDMVTVVPVGTAVHDRVAVTGAGAIPEGTITASWFGNGTCATPALVTSAPTTLVAGAVDLVGFEQVPALAGTYAFQAIYSGDADYVGASGPCQPLTVGTAPTLSGIPLSPVTVGAPFNFAFTVTGSPAPTVTKASGALPPGIALSSAGVLSGSTTTPGSYEFVARAANGVTPDALTGTLTIVVIAASAAPTLGGTPTTPATVGVPYNFAFTVGGSPAPTVTKDSGTLPPGLTLSVGGVLAGTPTTPGTYSFAARAANGMSPNSVTPALTVLVLPQSTGGATARGMKESARGLLIPFLVDSAALARAAGQIGASVEPGLWRDENRLDPRRGLRVFSSERRAAQELAKALRGRGTICTGVVAVELQYTGEPRAQVEAFDVAVLRQRLSSFSVNEGADFALRASGGRALPSVLSLVIAGNEVARIPVGCSSTLEVGDTFGPFVVTDIVTREVEEPRRAALSAAAAAAAIAAQERLVDADEVLARNALADAEALVTSDARRSRVNVLLSQSRREIAAAAASEAAGNAPDAIGHYMKAWLHSTAAARIAQGQ